jgi:saccharopine dehydrogenase-like NADP-dependent oxidoreductase
MPIPNMVEKTLRFPGHIQKIISIRDKGLFEIDKIDKTAQSLIEDWEPDEGDYDQTIMRLEFRGIINGEKISKIYNLIDYYDQKNHISSMARTTGYTCTAVANILLTNRFTQSGVYNLESLGSDDEIVKNILQYLAQRNVQFDKKI